jgi:hypothetical protein
LVHEAVREAVLLRQEDEICGKNQAAVRVSPARQDFKSDEQAGPQLNDGLEAGNKQVVVEGIG